MHILKLASSMASGAHCLQVLREVETTLKSHLKQDTKGYRFSIPVLGLSLVKSALKCLTSLAMLHWLIDQARCSFCWQTLIPLGSRFKMRANTSFFIKNIETSESISKSWTVLTTVTMLSNQEKVMVVYL